MTVPPPPQGHNPYNQPPTAPVPPGQNPYAQAPAAPAPQGPNPYAQAPAPQPGQQPGFPPQQPGQPGYPGQQPYPPQQQPYAPFPQQGPPVPPAKPRGKKAIRIVAVIAIAIVGTAVKFGIGWVMNRSDAETTSVGSCMHNDGTFSKPDLNTVDCSSGDSQYKVLDKFDNSSDTSKCETVSGATIYYVQTGSSHDVVLCLKETK
ncbi:hypothetical protein OK074_3850 [Actinobacteria bacterium OK074]|nr:hypothetical protein OK074_3850 [Actinobacteria bacterium OK074]